MAHILSIALGALVAYTAYRLLIDLEERTRFQLELASSRRSLALDGCGVFFFVALYWSIAEPAFGRILISTHFDIRRVFEIASVAWLFIFCFVRATRI
ncbi:MAG: hypothetical protein J0H17_07750 [Rhizobiales bacterium]|nr:hypothetical protein [Hyphomicrobiales bacterium]